MSQCVMYIFDSVEDVSLVETLERVRIKMLEHNIEEFLAVLNGQKKEGTYGVVAKTAWGLGPPNVGSRENWKFVRVQKESSSRKHRHSKLLQEANQRCIKECKNYRILSLDKISSSSKNKEERTTIETKETTKPR